MGLDKKPFPPKKKLADADEEKKDFRGKKVRYKLSDNSISTEETKDSVSTSSSPPEEEREFSGSSLEMEMETQRLKRARIKWERNLRSIPDYAYDEDFEADEEKSYGKVNEEGQADDQMNRMSKSPSDDEKDNLDHEKKSKKSSQKALQASDSERDESDGYSENDSEEDKQDRKCVPSLSSSSLVYSSENEYDHETRKQDDGKDNSDIHSEYENETQGNEGQETSLEEDISAAENVTDKSGPSITHENMLETNLQDITLVREIPKHVGSVDMNRKEDKEEDLLVHLESDISEAEHKSKELSDTEDRGEYKSVKEKIAEAIEKDHHLSSEPEVSDSSTEEEEEEEKTISTQGEVPDGDSLAEELKMFESQKAVVQTEQDKQMVGKERTLEEKLSAEENLKEAALGEELSAKNGAALPVKNELQIEETELKKAIVVESNLEMENAEKDIIYEDGKTYERKEQVEKLKGTVFGDIASKREEILGGYRVEREEVEGKKFTDGLMANEEASDGEEAVEERGETAAEKESYGVIKIVEEITEADVVMETAFMAMHTVRVTQKPIEEAESGGYETLKKSKREREPEGKVTENDFTEGRFLEGVECVNMELQSDSIEEELLAPEPKEEDITTISKKDYVSKESVPSRNGLVGEVSSDQEASYLTEDEFEETSQEVRKMKVLTTSEDSAPEKLKTWMEEPLLDWETERDISLTEEKNKGHEAIMTTEREKKADKPNAEGDTEKEESIKGRILVKELTQEEENLMQLMEEEIEEESMEKVPKPETADSEKKLSITKKEFFTEDAIEPEAIVMADEIIMDTQPEGVVDAEEAGKEGKIVIKRKAEGRVMKGKERSDERKGILKEQKEAEEAETERKVGSKRKTEIEEADMESEGVDKQKMEAEEAEIKVVLKGEAEDEEPGREVSVKGKVDAEEEEAEVESEVVDKQKMAEEAEIRVVLKGEAEDEEPRREVSVKGKVDAEEEEAEVESEVVDKQKMEAEEAEIRVVLKGEAEDEEPGREVSVKGKVDAEEEEAEVESEVVDKQKMEAEEAEIRVVLKGEAEDEEPEREVWMLRRQRQGKVDAEEAETGENVVIKGKVKAEHPGTKGKVVFVDARPKGEMVSEVSIVWEQSIESVTPGMGPEAEQECESSANVVLGAIGEKQERRRNTEARFQDEVETTEDTLRPEASVDARMQKEMVPAEDEKEAEEAGSEEEKLREEIIPVKYVEEALFFGIQKLITEVSQISVEAIKDGFEDLVEQMSSHDDTTREAVFVAAVDERQISQSDYSEERETKEPVEEIHLEDKDKSGKSQIHEEESQLENLPVTESFLVNVEHSETEQHQDITTRMIYLEAHTSSNIEDTN